MTTRGAGFDARTMRRLALAVITAAPSVVLLSCAVARRWMDDDAFINLRVVRNLLEGHGPVFNIGDRVEVYTSALWLFFLTALGALGARLETAAVWSGISFTVTGLVLAQLACMRLARHERASTPVPLGALVLASIPVMWDYASSGLESGLTFSWLGGSFFVVVRLVDEKPPALRRWLVAGALAGLGPLVRPELALYSAGFLFAIHAGLGQSPERRRRLLSVVAAAVALPLAYEIFRMGYFAALTPNTAIAKEAFRWNVRQGSCYARNFFGLYHLAPPLTALGLLWYVRARSLSDREDPLTSIVTMPVFAGALHGLYVVMMGGDYMHGRMFLPCVFAATMPAAMIAVPRGARVHAVAAIVVLAWAPICALELRVDRENVCYIGDERGWYARIAGVDNPVLLSDYRTHHFSHQADALLAKVQARCPDDAPPGSSGCRLVHVGDAPEYGALTQSEYRMNDSVDPRIRAIVDATAVGIIGYRLPSTIHVADHHGLGDPIGARIALAGRSRPGHEKQLANAWVVARFASRGESEDSSVQDARTALGCSPLADLDRATREPLTFGRFLSNLPAAFTFQRLRVPGDPTDAAERFCGAHPPPKVVAGGDGGWPYRWRCPARMTLSGVAVSSAEGSAAFTSIEARCRGLDGSSTAGPPIGTKGHRMFDLDCPLGTAVVGFHGRADTAVHELGVVCATTAGRGSTERGRGRTVGAQQGDSFQITCPEGTVAVGIAGRSGALIDAVGTQCMASP